MTIEWLLHAADTTISIEKTNGTLTTGTLKSLSEDASILSIYSNNAVEEIPLRSISLIYLPKELSSLIKAASTQ